jgi:hypothetical protein
MRAPSQRDKEREAAMKKLGMSHDDLMDELNARIQAMKAPATADAALPSPSAKAVQ